MHAHRAHVRDRVCHVVRTLTYPPASYYKENLLFGVRDAEKQRLVKAYIEVRDVLCA
jgi:hypothetical protein